MTPSWYDVLGVAPEATTDEIRSAWRTSVDGLDPTDRLFRQRNRAAEVLLDPQRRAAHDAELAQDDETDLDDLDDGLDDGPDDGPDAPPVVAPPVVAPVVTAAGPQSAPATDHHDLGTGPEDEPHDGPDNEPDKEPEDGPDMRDRGRRPTGRVAVLTVALGVLALALVIATVFAAVNRGGDAAAAAPSDSGTGSSTGSSSGSSSGGLPDQAEIQTAVSSARTAIVPILSYDYRTLADDEKQAESYMTPAFASEYGQYFSVVRNNAPRTQTVVTVQVLDAGVVRTAPGRVDVLLFVNRPRKNKQSSTVYHDQVTARMLSSDGSIWKVDCLITTPNGTCGH